MWSRFRYLFTKARLESYIARTFTKSNTSRGQGLSGEKATTAAKEIKGSYDLSAIAIKVAQFNNNTTVNGCIKETFTQKPLWGSGARIFLAISVHTTYSQMDLVASRIIYV